MFFALVQVSPCLWLLALPHLCNNHPEEDNPFRGRLLSSSPSTLSIIPISLPLLLLLPLDREKEKFARFSPSYFCCQKMEKKFWDATRDGRVEVVKDVLGKNLSLNANWNDDSLS